MRRVADDDQRPHWKQNSFSRRYAQSNTGGKLEESGDPMIGGAGDRKDRQKIAGFVVETP
jgi:hypothetical protein